MALASASGARRIELGWTVAVASGAYGHSTHWPVLPGHLERAAEQRLRRGRAEADDDLRLHDLELGLEPRPARLDLGGVRLGVNADLAAPAPPTPAAQTGRRLPLEVLDRVGHVRRPAVDAGFGQPLVEHPPRRSDEGPPGQVLLVARLLADEHQLGPRGALT